jgi:hypothetical protein
MNGLRIRPMRPGEISTAVNWAAAEGWNPGFVNDFYDIWILAQTCAFKDDRLARATRDERPKSQPNDPTGLHQLSPATRRNSSDDEFVEEVAVNPGPLVDVVEALASFLLPHAEKARNLHMKR